MESRIRITFNFIIIIQLIYLASSDFTYIKISIPPHKNPFDQIETSRKWSTNDGGGKKINSISANEKEERFKNFEEEETYDTKVIIGNDAEISREFMKLFFGHFLKRTKRGLFNIKTPVVEDGSLAKKGTKIIKKGKSKIDKVEEDTTDEVDEVDPSGFTFKNDDTTRETFGGSKCTKDQWEKCRNVKCPGKSKEPIYCMKHGETVWKCHLICMKNACGEEMYLNLENVGNPSSKVKKEGKCETNIEKQHH